MKCFNRFTTYVLLASVLSLSGCVVWRGGGGDRGDQHDAGRGDRDEGRHELMSRDHGSDGYQRAGSAETDGGRP